MQCAMALSLGRKGWRQAGRSIAQMQRLARFSRYWWKNANLVEQAAEESGEAIATALKDSDLVSITAGMEGGTGSSAAPIIAQISKGPESYRVVADMQFSHLSTELIE